jgi:hypothetical protein
MKICRNHISGWLAFALPSHIIMLKNTDKNEKFGVVQRLPVCNENEYRARIFKRLWSKGIDSKE